MEMDYSFVMEIVLKDRISKTLEIFVEVTTRARPAAFFFLTVITTSFM